MKFNEEFFFLKIFSHSTLKNHLSSSSIKKFVIEAFEFKFHQKIPYQAGFVNFH